MSTDAETLPAGTLVAERYRLGRYLGEGLPGAVYLATQEPLDRTVTVKILQPDTAERRDQVRFRREAEALARLSHPSCAEVIDYGEWRSLYYLVLRHVPGQLLDDALEEGTRWPAVQALTLAIDLAEGLAHAHAAGVVHRNLAPERVVLTTERTVRDAAVLVDFGLAHIGRTDLDTTAGQAPIGTPGYLAPERLRGEPGDPPADVFSVGIILYELLTGGHPYRRSTTADTLLATATEGIAPIDRVDPPLPTTPALTKAVLIATRPSPEDRFRDGRELVLALRAARLSVLHPELSRASFDVVDGVCALDDVFVERVDDPTPTLSPRRPPATTPTPAEPASSAEPGARGGSLGWIALAAAAVLVVLTTAGCAVGVGLQLTGWLGG